MLLLRVVRLGPIIAALAEFIDDVLVLLGTLKFLWHHPTSPASLSVRCNGRVADG
jgi:hypothetical protein